MRSRAKRVGAVIAAAAVVVAVVLLVARANSEAETDAPAAPRVLAVQTISIEPVNAYQEVHEYTGKIVARRTSQLGFESAGKLDKIHVDEGDSVTTGMALAELDTEHLENRRRQTIARRAQAAAKLDEMVSGPRNEDIQAAQARVKSLQAEVTLLSRQHGRRKALIARNVITHDEYEQFAYGLKARAATLAEAGHDLDELRNGTRKEQIEAQRAVVAELDAALADIDIDLRKSTLKAPFAGTIARRLADEGTVVEAGRPIFRLVEAHVLEAWIGLPVDAARRLAEASVHRVKIDGQYLHATVARRFPEVDRATRTRMVVLRLDDPRFQDVVHGQIVRLPLEETVEANGYWLPSTALTKGARGLWTSFVVIPTDSSGSTQSELFRIERRDVEVLHTESSRVLVRGTLSAGDRVVTSGTHRVVPGQLVHLTK